MSNKAEREHMGRVAALCCIVCRNENLGDTPAGIHHIRAGQGHKRASDYDTLPLCPCHHQDGDGTATYAGEIAYHHSPEEFERRYGTELELLEQVYRELGYERPGY